MAILSLSSLVPAAADTSPSLIASEHLRLDHPDGGDAYVFVIPDERSGGPATVAAVELSTGERIFLWAKFEPASGTAVHRMDDLSTGWYMESVVDSGLRHIGPPGTVGGGSTSAWLEHVVELTRDPSFQETIRLETADGGVATWQNLGSDSPDERRAKEEAAIRELGRQMKEAVPPPTARRAVALLETLISEHGDSMLDHFEDLVHTLDAAFETAELASLRQDGESRHPRSVRVPLTSSEKEIERLIKPLKIYVHSSTD